MNLSLVTKSTGKHPWFPGPLLVHRSKGQDEFQHFWQAVKRGCPAYQKLKVLWTDEDSAVYNGILSETLGTVHLLSFEHVKANIERKLDELKFPAFEKRGILADIFGGPRCGPDGCLYECETAEEFSEKVFAFKEQWNALERSATLNKIYIICIDSYSFFSFVLIMYFPSALFFNILIP